VSKFDLEDKEIAARGQKYGNAHHMHSVAM